MEIIRDNATLDNLVRMAAAGFGNLVKAVVDIERGILAIDGELHSDLEALLIADGSNPSNLWGINLYPELKGGDFIEFDSMINVRPSQGNRSRGVDDPVTRGKIAEVVTRRVLR